MKKSANYLAVDLGASSGRVLLGRWNGSRFKLEELHRFPNDPVNILGHQHWDVLRLWEEIKAGIACYAAQYNEPLAGIGVDTWGVDYALIDSKGNLMGNPYHYRDVRTNGVMELVFQKIPRHEVFEKTGIQFIQLNTLYQLYSMVQSNDPQLNNSESLLMMPDLFHYWLTGQKASEFTIASTSQMLSIQENDWAKDMLEGLQIPIHLFQPIVPPGTILGNMRSEVLGEVGMEKPVPIIASGCHDTASAVAAIPGLAAQDAYISSGTWSLMGVEIPEPIVNRDVLNLNFTNEGGVANTTRLLKNLTGLWLLQESQRQWQREGLHYSWNELLSLGENAQPFQSLIDPDSPDFMNPADMLHAIRTFCQKTGQPEPDSEGAIVRCCLESLALKYRWVLNALETLTGKWIRTIRIVGGGSQNGLLCQFTADACQRPVVTGPVEATALGNILMQSIATGHIGDISTARQVIADSIHQKEFEPGPREAWDQAFERFRKLQNPI